MNARYQDGSWRGVQRSHPWHRCGYVRYQRVRGCGFSSPGTAAPITPHRHRPRAGDARGAAATVGVAAGRSTDGAANPPAACPQHGGRASICARTMFGGGCKNIYADLGRLHKHRIVLGQLLLVRDLPPACHVVSGADTLTAKAPATQRCCLHHIQATAECPDLCMSVQIYAKISVRICAYMSVQLC